MKRVLTFCTLFLVLLALPMLGRSTSQFVAAHDAQERAIKAPITDADVSDALRSSPVMFIENVGQFDDDARFQVRGGDLNLWLADNALWITLLEAPDEAAPPQSPLGIGGKPDANREPTSPRRGVNLKLSFVDANPQPKIEPFDLLETKMNYFLGNDSDKWRSNVPTYGGVRYKEIYPGIDLELTSENGHTVQRLVAQSPANLDAVQLRVEGADEMELSSNRTSGHTIGLTVKTAMGDLTLPLFALVSPDGTPLDSSSSPTLNSNRIQAPFARHSSPNDLRLASNTSLAYSTFIGGSTYDNARSLALDSAGNAVVAGQTPSLDFPTTAGSYDMTHNGNEDMFVLKLNAAGNGLIYSTFIGSSNYDFSESLALDSAGNAVVTGTTNSDDFPTTPGSYDTTYNNTPNFFDAAKNNLIHGDFSGDTFVLKLNAAGNDLIYSTFIGGSSNDVGDSVALDSAGNAVVTGYTESENFPTTPNSYDTIHNGYGDGFTVKLNAAGSDLIYSTFIGGSLNDSSGSVALDSAGNAVVTGITESDDFPTTPGSYDTTLNNKFMLFDMFVLKLNAAGNDLIYSTFIGGSRRDNCLSVALDSADNVVITGYTDSDDFPTTQGSYDTTHNGDEDAFVLKLNAAGNDLIYSTFIGGEDNDNANSMALDSTGHVVVTGDTNSDDFPTTLGSIETTDNEYENIFVLKLNEVGLIYSTLIGGSDDDEAESLALDSAGNAVVMGVTYSDDFPTTAGSYDTTHNGEYDKDTFVLRLDGLDSEEGANFSISGRVTYSSGRGIEGLTLSAGSGSATTNRNGDYITTHLPSGEYTLTPEKAGYTFDPESRSVSIQGAHVTDQDFIAIRLPSLTINHSVGAPGSSFTIRGRNYPANTSVSIAINRQNLGTVQVNQSGGLTFLLTTPNADVGAYGVTASASTQMRAGISFMLDSAAPLQPQEGEGETFEVPADIAYTQLLYLPIVIR